MSLPHQHLSRAFRRSAVCLLAVLPVGCEVREEAVRPPGPPRARWQLPVTSQRDARAEDRAQTSIAYLESLEAARRLAASSGRPLLLFFRAEWCRWSAATAEQVLADRRVVALSDRFVCASLDADRHAAICREHDVSSYPTLLLLGGDGGTLARLTGRPTADDLLAAMQDATATVAAIPRTDAAARR